MIGRREFITLLGGAAAWPIAARAQQPGKLPTIGYLGQSTLAVESQLVAAFVQRLGELGWVEGRTVAIELRWGEGRNDRFAEYAAEFVRLEVDVIVATGTANIVAAKRATSVIPIVFAAAGNPVGSGLVASLARPGGNLTGLSTQAVDLAGKRLEFLREVIPGPGRLAVMGNVGNPSIVLEMSELQAAARTLGFEIVALEIHKTEDIVPAFESLKGRADALYVVFDALVSATWNRINTLALGARLPTMSGNPAHVEVGALMSYAPNSPRYFGAPPTMSTRFCAGRSRAISRSSNRPSSIWSSTWSPPRPLDLPSRPRCSPVLTR
jgi:putative ABC transport system substrate-binding protein